LNKALKLRPVKTINEMVVQVILCKLGDWNNNGFNLFLSEWMKGVKPVVNLWLTEKDLRYRWSEVKKVFWAEFEGQLKFLSQRLLEESLKTGFGT